MTALKETILKTLKETSTEEHILKHIDQINMTTSELAERVAEIKPTYLCESTTINSEPR